MWRTYKSKKETGLDPRHVKDVETKSSVFDAFYIENLKQAKRELSCLGVSKHYLSSNIVRKKKYVKRLKESEFVRESTSQYSCLTPDKSLRVNKAEDLFDKLLRCSPPLDSPVNTQNIIKKTFKRKSYGKRKKTNIKRINYSSSGSEDKENDQSNTFEHSDVKSHKLIVEKERYIKPNSLNDSVENIDKNVSLFSHLQRQSNGESQTPLKNMKQIRSSVNGESPLCSTPFHEKYRGQSIYTFSPILVHHNSKVISQTTDCSTSNTITTPCKNVLKKTHKTNCSYEHKNQILINVNDTNVSDDFTMNNDVKETKDDTKSYPNNYGQSKNCDISHNKSPMENISQNQNISVILQCTEPEHFLGFSIKNKKSEMDKLNQFKEIHENILANYSTTYTDTELSCEPLLGFIKADASVKNDIENSLSNYKENDISSDSHKIDAESLYDTCSENESRKSNDSMNKEPIVVIERLDNSILMKYLKKMDAGSGHSESKSHHSSDEYTSFDTNVSNMSSDCAQDSSYEIDESSSSSGTESNIQDNQGISFVTTRRRNEKTNDSFIFSIDNLSNSINILDRDETFVSNLRNSVDVDCTLVNNIDIGNNDDITNRSNENEAESTVMNIEEIDTVPSNVRESDNFEQPGNSITCRQSNNPVLGRPSMRYNLRQSTKADDTLCNTKSILNNSNIKHPIVLQPGKKWERSLSIYRRMTTMVDGMDCSLLDIESLENKGRKYRQSVIATMEMQDLNASLNNESIKSRRSTFVSKPVRSTIKLDSNASRTSICSSTVIEDFQGFLTEDCDDTVIDLSKLSLGDSEVEVTILENFHEPSIRSTTARDYVLRRCNQTDALLFDECYPDAALKNCHKIGEGVYGEVFLWRAGDGQARVLKVIPVAGSVIVNGEQQKDYDQIISEIVIAMELSALGAPIPDIERHLNEGKSVETLDLHSVENATNVFNKVLAVRLVCGSYPSRLLDLWELYDECKGSENDNPAALPAAQHYVVLELANAGQDLEGYHFHNAEQAYALFKQVAFALAVAEEAYEFEHRDLHWGNVLIAPTDQKYVTFVVRGRPHRVWSRGVRCTLIDYSLSRASAGARALYCDLGADDALFDALGDYQFDVYRLMRERVGNDWKTYEPYTNILWLHYTADKMISALRYTRTNTKVHKHYIAILKDVKNRILNYGSATEYVLTDNEI